MRFNFETTRRGKCIMDINTQDSETIATVWYGLGRSAEKTTYPRSIVLPDFYKAAFANEQAELLARLVINHFDAFGGFPGRNNLATSLSHTWYGQLETVG